MPSEKTKREAIAALDGMRTIVKREMLVRGKYVTDEIKNKKLAEEGAICGGRQYCAIGSLWIGGGVKLNVEEFKDTNWHTGIETVSHSVELPGVDQDRRYDFLKGRHGLRLAYKSLNSAAADYIEKYDLEDIVFNADKTHFTAEIEALFENGFKSRKLGSKVGRPELLKIITSAKRKVNATS